MNVKTTLLLVTLALLECTPVAMSEPEEVEGCRVRAGETVSVRDPRLRDPACVIEVGARFSVSWDEYALTPIKKVELISIPMCGREDEIVLLEQAAMDKLDAMQSLPMEVTRSTRSCEEKPRVDVVIVETGV